MSLFNKDYQNRSGLKCNIVYTDYINDIPIGNYLNTNTNNDNINCTTCIVSGELLSNSLVINYGRTLIDNQGNLFTQGNININNICNINASTGDITTLNNTGLYNGVDIVSLNNTINNYIYNNNIILNTAMLECDNGIDKKVTLSPTQLLFQTYLMDTYIDKFKIDYMGNITTTGTINDIIINDIITTNNIKTLSNKTLQNPSINDGIYTGQQTFSNAPIMSGGSITSSSIPDTALTSNVALKNGTNTWSAKQTFSVAPIMSGASITSATILDTALSSNVALLNSTNTWIINNQYLNTCSTLRTGNVITLTPPLFEIYPLSPITASMTINIPAPSALYLGTRLLFRRVGGINTTVINVSPNIYPINSVNTTNILLSATQWAISIYCCYLTATTYAWFAF